MSCVLPALHSIYRWLPQELAFLTANFFQQLDSPTAISDFHVSFFQIMRTRRAGGTLQKQVQTNIDIINNEK